MGEKHQNIHTLKLQVDKLKQLNNAAKQYIDNANDDPILMPGRYEAWLKYQREVKQIGRNHVSCA